MLPDYTGGGVTNLMSTLSQLLGGGDTGYAPLHGFDMKRAEGARTVVLLVIDGLGYDHLLRVLPAGNLTQHCSAAITSVCPSTTASAVPTFLTGVPPQQHGFTGWFSYFAELGAVLAVLPYRTRLGYMPVDASVVSPADLSGVRPLFARLPLTAESVMPDWIAGSTFNRAFCAGCGVRAYKNLAGLFKTIVQATKHRERSKFVYAYWPGFDALAHQHGVDSPEASAHLAEIDRRIGSLLTTLRGSDSLLLVTADHGFVDTRPQTTLSINQHPQLAELLMAPLCGEPRLAYCYVHPRNQQAFERYVSTHLSSQVELYPSQQLIDEGWFGLGEPHPQLVQRVGHFALLAKDDHKIVHQMPGEAPLQQIGVHGGLSRQEMLVPLSVMEA